MVELWKMRILSNSRSLVGMSQKHLTTNIYQQLMPSSWRQTSQMIWYPRFLPSNAEIIHLFNPHPSCNSGANAHKASPFRRCAPSRIHMAPVTGKPGWGWWLMVLRLCSSFNSCNGTCHYLIRGKYIYPAWGFEKGIQIKSKWIPRPNINTSFMTRPNFPLNLRRSFQGTLAVLTLGFHDSEWIII